MARAFGLVIWTLTGGGAENSVLRLAVALRRLGHVAHVFVLQDKVHYELPEGLPVHVVPVRKRLVGTVERGAQQLIREVAEVEAAMGRPFSLFVSNLDKTNEIVAAAELEPAVYVIRSSVEAELRTERRRGPLKHRAMLRRKRALNGKHLVTISRGLADEIVEVGRIRPASIRHIYNPYPIEEIRRLAEDTPAGLPDAPFLLHVGRAIRDKRHDVLFEAFRQVPEPYRLVVLARRTERLRRLARRFGIAERVDTPGFDHNPYAWMRRARLTLLSSDREGLGNVLVESLLVGTPVVSTNCTHGPAEILSGELARWLVPTDRPDLLGARINEALETEIDLSGWTMGHEAQADRIAERYVTLAEELERF